MRLVSKPVCITLSDGSHYAYLKVVHWLFLWQAALIYSRCYITFSGSLTTCVKIGRTGEPRVIWWALSRVEIKYPLRRRPSEEIFLLLIRDMFMKMIPWIVLIQSPPTPSRKILFDPLEILQDVGEILLAKIFGWQVWIQWADKKVYKLVCCIKNLNYDCSVQEVWRPYHLFILLVV
jgi:hypothetical protein